MLQPILIILFFLFIAVLMITRKIQTMLALPVLAVGIALLSGAPLIGKMGDTDVGIFTTVINAGLTSQASAMMSLVLAAWLGQLMTHTGVSKRIVRTAAELGGDKALLVTICMSVATALLSMVLTGLGSTIMVGSIVLPIMLSVGVPSATAACIFLASRGIGLSVSVSSWQQYISLTGVAQEDIRTMAFILCGLTALTVLLFIIIEFKRNGMKFSCAQKAAAEAETDEFRVPALSLLTPVVPVLLVLIFNIAINVALVLSIVYLYVVSVIFNPKKISQITSILNRSGVEGVSNSGSALILLMGIGILLKAVTHPMVQACLDPLFSAIIPSTFIGYVIFFILVAPLSLYRGPMNMWGLGSGIIAIVMGTGNLPANAVVGAFLASERIQSISDPTNSHSVWTANFVGCEVNQIMFKLLPYLWGLASIGVVVSAVLYM